MILAGDIGGTKVNLHVFSVDSDGTMTSRRSASYPSSSAGDLETLLDRFLEKGESGTLRAACFGIAGPVMDQRCITTNLPWEIDARALRRHLGVSDVWLLNDLEATGYGIATLPSTSLRSLQAGTPRVGHAALVAAGTGLGESLLFWNGSSHVPMPSEGGHTEFGPRDPLEHALWQFLSRRYGHVSCERILSGKGIADLFEFMVEYGRKPSAALLQEVRSADDAAPVITTAALNGSCPVCVETVDRFLEIYGAEAGNLALKGLTVGGIFIGGGIAPKLEARMGNGAFLRGLHDKGRFRGLMESLPVSLILEQETAVRGAAAYAARMQGVTVRAS